MNVINFITLLVCFTNLTLLGEALQFTPNKKIDITKVINYPLEEPLKRYIKDYNLEYKTAKEHEIEFKRWLIISQDSDQIVEMFSPEIDNYWHTLLLYTREYAKFCSECFGRFIHHNPYPITDIELK